MIRGRFIRLAAALSVFLAFLLVTGCGGGPKLPPTAPVSGVVTLNNHPLPRGMVQFVPDVSKGTNGAPAVGNIGPDGRFKLQTAGKDGAIVGQHKVAVESRQEVDMSKGSWAPSLIPEKYNNPDRSGLTFEVKAGKDNTFDIQLSSKP